MIKKKLLKIIYLVFVICMFFSLTAYGFSLNSLNFKGIDEERVQESPARTRNGDNNNNNNDKISQYMKQQNIMKGDSNGNYNWDQSIKRGDLMLMIVRAFGLTGSSKNNFSDVPYGSYYYDAIATTKSLGISKGDGINFNPEKNVSIEEALSLIERASNVSGKNINTEIELEDLFDSGIFSEYATREQIAEMLYYILGGETDDTGDTGQISGNLDNIEYTADSNTKINFDEDDFIDVFEELTGDELYSVKFSIPSSAFGKLYYGYDSSDDYDSLVNSSEKYYADDEPYISEITFVPYEDYSGTSSIYYTAYDEDGNSYGGAIKITVEADEDTELDTIKYTVDTNDEVDFDEDDFNDVFEELTGDELYSVKFSVPSASFGKLYYGYDSSDDYDSLVKASKKYYVDEEPYISEITFVPYEDYSGTSFIYYTAYDEDGNSYDGTVKIVVE